MEDNIIQVMNVTKTYKIYNNPMDRLKESISPFKKSYSRNFNALENVNFSVRRGENIGIIGTNGSGKSTLLKIITGVLNPSEGGVSVKGKISALLELGTGFNMEYTGIENIYLNGTMMGYTKEEMDLKLKSILDFAGIGDFVKQPVKTYSSGMFARLAFAVAINVEPEILIVDEALSVGDTRFQLKCMNKMKEMMSGGTTVLFVSHDTNAVKRFCTRAIWLNSGVMLEDGDVNMVTDHYLDFLKMGEKVIELEEKVEKNIDDDIPFVPGENIAEIVAFHMYNDKKKDVSRVDFNERVVIEIVYDVYDESIENPVLGVAIRGMDDDYVCGVNTLLDKSVIPWKYGRNRFYIEYSHGIRAVGGKYYFDAALMDETATVNICYKAMIREFSIVTSYVGEGRYIIPHKWGKEIEIEEKLTIDNNSI